MNDIDTQAEEAFESRRCPRVYFPNDPKRAFVCNNPLPFWRRADAVWCSLRCKEAGRDHRRTLRRRGEL